MKKIFKRGIALLLCLTMIFNYSFSVLADENVESSKPETTYTETVETTESPDATESIEEIGEEVEEEALDNSSEEIIEPEDDNEDIEDVEEEPEEASGDTFDEPIGDNEDINNTEPKDELGNNDDAFNDIEKNAEEVVAEINNEVDVDKEIDIEDIEYATPSEAEEEIENETEIEKDVEESTPSDVDEIIEDIETATQSEIKDSTDYFIREKIVDNIIITLTADKGVFPENAELFVEKVEDEYTNDAVDEAINKEKSGEENKTTTLKFDIKVIFNGEEIQPDTEKGTVKVAFTFEEKIENSENINAYHLKEDKNGDLTAEKLNTEVTTDDTNSEKEVTKIEAETDGFSIYAIELPNNLFGAAGPHPTVNYDGRNWMSHIPDNTKLALLTIPGTHDSATYNIKFTDTGGLYVTLRKAIIDGLKYKWLSDIVNMIVELIEIPLMKYIKRLIEKIQSVSGTCQDLTIQQQLDAGVRAFDFRFRHNDGGWGIYHGCDNNHDLQSVFTTCVCYDGDSQLTLRRCFETIKTFLNNHPTEVIFLNVQNEGGSYSKDIEKQLLELENEYGFCVNFAEREFTKTVLDENPSLKMILPTGGDEPHPEPDPPEPIDPAIKYFRNTTLNAWRGKVIDFTDSEFKVRRSDWSGTKESVFRSVDEYLHMESLFSAKCEYLGELQTNIMVKLYRLNDPHGECGLPFDVSFIPETKMPISIKWNIDRMIISPKAQASYVNPKFLEKLNGYEPSILNPDGIISYGIITMDFQSENNCYNIVKKSIQIPGGPNFQWTSGSAPAVPGEIPLDEDEYYTIDIQYPEGYIEYLKSILDKSNSSGSSGGSSGGTPRYDSEGNVLGPSGIQNYTYDGSNPPNLAGNINVSSWNSGIGTQQANNIKYVQGTDSFVKADNTPVVTDWVGVTTNDIGKVMWYRTDATGKILKNQFIQVGNNIYYLDNNGIMVTGQVTINGKVYNFDTTAGATEGRFLY